MSFKQNLNAFKRGLIFRGFNGSSSGFGRFFRSFAFCWISGNKKGAYCPCCVIVPIFPECVPVFVVYDIPTRPAA